METQTQPSQPGDRRQVRSDLRALLQSTRDRHHDLDAGGGEKIREILLKADELTEHIQKPQEEVMAAEIFSLATHHGLKVARKMALGGKSFTPADFVRRLKASYVADVSAQQVGAMDPSAFSWAGVGRRLSGWFRPAPTTFHMLGPMDAAPKAKRPAPQRRKRDPVAEAVRPDEVEERGEHEKQETDKNMETMWDVLEAQPGEKAPMLELVMNHVSFAQTVENLFALSFLVRDERVELKQGAAGVEVVLYHRKHGANKGNKESERLQFVVSVDFQEWEEWKTLVDPSAALMPHRHDPHGNGNAAAGEQQQRQGGEEEGDGGEAGPSNGHKRRRKSK